MKGLRPPQKLSPKSEVLRSFKNIVNVFNTPKSEVLHNICKNSKIRGLYINK